MPVLNRHMLMPLLEKRIRKATYSSVQISRECQEECLAAVKLLDEEASRLSKSSGYGLKMLPLPLYAGEP